MLAPHFGNNIPKSKHAELLTTIQWQEGNAGGKKRKYDDFVDPSKVSAVRQHKRYVLQYKGDIRGWQSRQQSNGVAGMKVNKWDTKAEAEAATTA